MSNTDNNPRIIAAIYARVSTSHQEEQKTIESQIAEVEQRIKNDGCMLPSQNIFIDNGWTGSVLERPGLEAMRDAATEGRFDRLYVYDRGRLSRSFVHQEVLLEELYKLGIEFLSLHDMKVQTPEDAIFQGMQGLFQDYERIKIGERFRRGKQHKINNGVLIQAHALYGYKYYKKSESSPARYEVDECQAGVVKQIFEWAADGVSQREIIRRLHDLRIAPPKNKSEYWTKGPIARLLRETTYVDGVLHYYKNEAIEAKESSTKYRRVKKNSRRSRDRSEWKGYYQVEPIVGRELFERVQKRIQYNQKYLNKKRVYDYLLSGLIYCDCGQRRAGDGASSTGHRYYRCIERIKRPPGQLATCKLPGVNAKILDEVVWKQLQSILSDDNLIKSQAERWLESLSISEGIDEARIGEIDERMDKIKREEGRYVRAYGEGVIGFEELVSLKEDTKRKMSQLKEEMNKLSNKNQASILPQINILDLCQEAQNVLNSLEQADKKTIIHELLDKIIIKEGNKAEAHVRIPLSALKLEHVTQNRNCRTSQCRKIDTLQRITQKIPGFICKLPICHH